jgi:hypothetical protein
MQVVVRAYSGEGATQVFDLLEQNKTEVENLMREVQGIVSYTLARNGDGGYSVTICQDKAGIDESVEKARAYIQSIAGNITASAPDVLDGAIIIHV